MARAHRSHQFALLVLKKVLHILLRPNLRRRLLIIRKFSAIDVLEVLLVVELDARVFDFGEEGHFLVDFVDEELPAVVHNLALVPEVPRLRPDLLLVLHPFLLHFQARDAVKQGLGLGARVDGQKDLVLGLGDQLVEQLSVELDLHVLERDRVRNDIPCLLNLLSQLL